MNYAFNARIGYISWAECEGCKHYRPVKGGCDPVDKLGSDIAEIDFDINAIYCREYEEKEE